MKIHPLSRPPSNKVLADVSSGNAHRLALDRPPSTRAKGTRESMIQRLDSSKEDVSVHVVKGCTDDHDAVRGETSALRWRSDDEWEPYMTSDPFQMCSGRTDDDPSRRQEVQEEDPDLQVSGKGGARLRELTEVLQDATAQNQGNRLPVLEMIASREGKIVSAVADPGMAPNRVVTSTGATLSSCSFVKIISLRKLNAKRRLQRCQHCPLLACALWEDVSSRKRDYVCVDCQEEVYGGWPAPKDLLGKAYLTDAQIQTMIQKCSQQKEPFMPPAYIRP